MQEQERSGRKGVPAVGNCTWDGVGDGIGDVAEHTHQWATAHVVVGSKIEVGEHPIVTTSETVDCGILQKDS